MLALFAQQAVAGGYGVAEVAIFIVIVAALVAVVIVAVKAMDIAIPPWVWHIFGVILVAVVSIVAIRFLMRL